MSSHDARQENQPNRDEPGATTTRPDPEAVDRSGPMTEDGPVLLPVDAGPEPTVDERATAGDTAPVTMVDPEDSKDLRSDDREVITGRARSDAGDPTTTPDRTSDDTDASLGPDTETGARKDPVPDGVFGTEAPTDASAAATSTAAGRSDDPSAASAAGRSDGPSGGPSGGPEADWHELQGRFVDDPEAAVREAGALLEKAISELRTRSESGSTEDLRTAFRRYRDLYTQLS
jgi:hypothetical protein